MQKRKYTVKTVFAYIKRKEQLEPILHALKKTGNLPYDYNVFIDKDRVNRTLEEYIQHNPDAFIPDWAHTLRACGNNMDEAP